MPEWQSRDYLYSLGHFSKMFPWLLYCGHGIAAHKGESMLTLVNQVKSVIQAVAVLYDGKMLDASIISLLGGRTVMVVPDHRHVPSAIQRARATTEWVWLAERLREAGFQVHPVNPTALHMIIVGE